MRHWFNADALPYGFILPQFPGEPIGATQVLKFKRASDMYEANNYAEARCQALNL